MKRINLEWQGPFFENDLENLNEEGNEVLKGKGIYQIYGSHPVTGTNTLLYIGQTKGNTMSLGKRIYNEINSDNHIWYFNTGGKVEFYVAESCLGKDGKCSHPNCKEWNSKNCKCFVQSDINRVERLLIIGHMPPCNSQSLGVTHRNQTTEEHFLIYNNGYYNRLLPCLSSEYYGLTIDEEEE